MEFLRSDTHHLDACVITWNHPETRMKVTIYPMVHVGSESFYQRVSEDLSRCQFVLYEGVSWRSKTGRPSGWDLLARNLGLADQGSALKYPAGAVRVNLDMSRGEFRDRLLRLPLKSIVFIMTRRYLMWLVTLPGLSDRDKEGACLTLRLDRFRTLGEAGEPLQRIDLASPFSPSLSAPVTVVVTPLECQSNPGTHPKA